jgi:hypothetical protein
VNKHLLRLVAEEALVARGNTRNRSYALRPLDVWHKSYDTTAHLAEDVVWRQDVAPAIQHLPENIRDIWHYGFTEMFNNVIDHASRPTGSFPAVPPAGQLAPVRSCPHGHTNLPKGR